MEKSTVPTRSPSEQGDPGVRRPMNSFLIFAREHRTTVQREHPGKDNKAISKVLGDMWFNLSQDERLPFILKAKAIADQHRKDHPNFRYRKGGKTTAKPRTVSTASTTRPAGGNESAEWAMVQNSQQHGERMRPTGWDESSRWEEHDIIRYSRRHEPTHARPEWEGYTEGWESPPSFPSRRMSQASSGPVINRSLSHGHSSMQSSPSIPSIEYGHAPPSPIFPLHTSKATGENNHQSRMEVPYAQTRRFSDPQQPVWNGKAREDSLEPHPVYYTNTAVVPPRHPAHYENPTRRTSGPGPERSPRSQSLNTHPYESTRRQSEPYQLLANRPRAWRGDDRSPTSLPESIPDPVWNSNSARHPQQSEIVERSRSSSWGDIYTASTFLGVADRDDWLEDVKGLSLRKVGSKTHSTESRTPPSKENSSGARKSGLWSVDSLL